MIQNKIQQSVDTQHTHRKNTVYEHNMKYTVICIHQM